MTKPETFNEFVNMIKNSGVWEPGKPILLDACNAGKLDVSIASTLAMALNTTVVAPTTQTWNFPAWSTSGITGAYPPIAEEKNTTGNNLPNIFSPGKWKTFGPDGKVIAVDTKPPGAK